MRDLFVCGSSFASGATAEELGGIKSWVRHFAEKDNFKNVWNISLPGRPLGLTTSDTMEFVRSYYDRYGNFDNLFVILEYTFPTYRSWDPLMSSLTYSNKTDIIPVAYYKMLKNNRNLANPLKLSSLRDESQYIEIKYHHRTTKKFIDHIDDNSGAIYHEVNISDIDPVARANHMEKVKEWFEYDKVDEENNLKSWSEEKVKRYYTYANNEIHFLKKWLEHYNIPYLMLWAVGLSEGHCKFTDRVFYKIIQTKRMIPMTEFTMVKASKEMSIKPWRSHPDAVGHEKISEYLVEWVNRYKLKERPNSTIFTGSF